VPRTPKIVDTNVCVVSNRRLGENVQCASKCAKELNDIVTKGLLVIDAGGAVFGEYRKHLSFAGQPGIGDVLFKWLVDNRYRTDRVAQIPLTPHPVREADYAEFPDDPALDGFDIDDRIFVALALTHPQRPAILNAVDSDYWHFRMSLTGHGVNVIHVCGHQHYKPRVPA
jgi:hypothetical protein